MTLHGRTLSEILFYCCVACVAGIALSLWSGMSAWIAVGAAGACVVSGLAGNRRFFVAALACSALAFGIYAGHRALEKTKDNEIRERFQMGQVAAFKGKIARDIDYRVSRANIAILPQGMKRGLILVSLDRGRAGEFRYGDVVSLKGTVEEAPVFDDFDYKAYLEKDQVYALMQNPVIERDTPRAYRGAGQKAYGFLLDATRAMNGIIERKMPYPESALLKALLFGNDGEMPDAMKDAFNKTGVRHMVAVSGQHIAIMVPLLLSLFLALGFHRHFALYGALGAISLFIVLTGMSPSALRAGIMGVMMLGAKIVGRMNAPARALLFAATLMLLLNPLLLSRDVGFQLSFAATLGIILLYPWMRARIPFVEKKGFVGDALALTMSAQIFTLPLSIQSFHYVSLISLATNVISAPLMPLFMILGFLFLYASLVSPFLGMIAGAPLSLLLSAFWKIMEAFSAIPFAFLEGAAISFMFLLLYGMGVAWLLWISRTQPCDMVYYTI